MADSYDNARTSLLFVNQTASGAPSISGYHRDADGTEYAVGKGVITTKENGANRIDYGIFDKETHERVGNGFFVKRTNEQKHPQAPIADGRIELKGDAYGVCVRPAEFADGSTGFNVWPSNSNRGNISDCGF